MNIWRTFQELLPADPLLAGEVISHNGDGTSTIELPAGERLRGRGQGVAIGQSAFVQGGEVRGQAPNLPGVIVEV